MSRVIVTSLAPNTQSDDGWLALRLICSPWKWGRGSSAQNLEKSFCEFLPTAHTFSFDSGRTCLLALLASLGLQKDDEVLVQAFTCVAVPGPVLWAEMKPVYVDCDLITYGMDPEDLEQKITSKSKVLIIQHTLGRPAQIERLVEIAKRHRIIVIEDCAHTLGASVNGKRVGTFGDAAFFSFGRDKVISSVFGGMLVTSSDDLAQKIQECSRSYPYPRSGWILQQLLHLIIATAARETYGFGITGKVIIEMAKRLHLISKAVLPIERQGGRPPFVGKRYANALASLAMHQFKKLNTFTVHRMKIAKIYEQAFLNVGLSSAERWTDGMVPLRYSIRVKNRRAILQAARASGYILGDWYTVPIAPEGVSYEKIGYKQGSCPNAETLAAEIVNLPTHVGVSENDAKRLISVLIPLLRG